MAIWHESPGQAGTPQTHVLVIGTSLYDGLPAADPKGRPPLADDSNIFRLAQVESPAISAFRIASWFWTSYNNPGAPIGKVWLLLSPSEKELAGSPEMSAAAAQIERSTTANAEADLKAWQDACATHSDNIAILYAAGHGVILSQEDAFVLLADYTKKVQPLNGSLDIGAIKRGMVGLNMAKVQIYFSDACRLPAADQKWQELGHGLAVSGRMEGADGRSIGIYFSATPFEAAGALKGKRTLFSQALLDCLNGAAVVRQDDGEASWHITIDSLFMFLKGRLAALSREQKMEGRTQGDSVTLHIPRQAPEVSLTITMKPPPNPTATWIRLWNGDHNKEVRAKMALPAHPVVVSRLTPGLYSLDVGFDPPVEQPFADRYGIAVDAGQPPKASRVVEFP